MPRRAASVTQADVARVIRAARQTGLEGWRVVVRDGAIYLEPLPPDPGREGRDPPRDRRPPLVL